MLAPNPEIAPKGIARLATKNVDGKTRLHVFYQESAAKIRIPQSDDGRMEAVLINTSGGLTGGDRIAWQVAAGENTSVTVTTQPASRSTNPRAARLVSFRDCRRHRAPDCIGCRRRRSCSTRAP